MSVDKFGRYIHEKQSSNQLKRYEKTSSGLYIDTDGNFNIQKRRIKNGGFPKEDADIVIKAYVDKAIHELRVSLTSLITNFQIENEQSFDGVDAIDIDTDGNFKIQRKTNLEVVTKKYVDESIKRLRDSIVSHQKELIVTIPDVAAADIEARLERLELVITSIIEKYSLS